MAVLLTIVFIDLIGFGLVIPLLPFYAERHGASPELVTLVMASYSAAQLVAAPLLGRASDRHGRRPVLLLSLAGSAASYLWLGVADTLWMLFAARLLQGACAGNIAAAQAYIADVTRPEDRARGMGMIGAAFGVGFIVGPALGGFLAGSEPTPEALALPAYVGAALSALALAAAFLALPESLPPEKRGRRRESRLEAVRGTLARPALRRLILLNFVVVVAFAGMETTFAMWASRQFDWGPLEVGWIFAYVGVLTAAMQGGLIGRLTKRWGEERLLVAGLGAIAAGLVVTPLATNLLLLLVGSGLLALGMGLTQPSLNSLLSRAAGPTEQGRVMGVAQSAGSLARILGPAAAGVLFGQAGRAAPFLAGASLVLAAILLAVRVRGREAPAAAVSKP